MKSRIGNTIGSQFLDSFALLTLELVFLNVANVGTKLCDKVLFRQQNTNEFLLRLKQIDL